jgi:hypothetical protein
METSSDDGLQKKDSTFRYLKRDPSALRTLFEDVADFAGLEAGLQKMFGFQSEARFFALKNAISQFDLYMQKVSGTSSPNFVDLLTKGF